MNYNYKIYYIKKKSGKFRKICVPNDELKAEQRKQLDILTDKIPLHKVAYAFIRNKSIIDNAKVHLNSECILNIDLSDFFDTVNYEMVLKSLIDNHIEKEYAEYIADIATIKPLMHLPQGSPLSPFLANLYCKPMDKKIYTLCRNNNLKYTRYADDISISGNVDTIKSLHKEIHNIILSYNLKINYKKEELCFGYKKKVTGINVYKKISFGRKRYQECRTALHRLNKTLKKKTTVADCENTIGSSVDSLIGKISFMSYVNPDIKHIKEKSKKDFKKVKNMNKL